MMRFASPRLMRPRLWRLRSSSSEPVSSTMRGLRDERSSSLRAARNAAWRESPWAPSAQPGSRFPWRPAWPETRQSSCPSPHRPAAAGAWDWVRACRSQFRRAPAFAPAVGWKGSTSRMASRTLSLVAKAMPWRSFMRRRLSSRPSSRKNSSSKMSRRWAGVEKLCNCETACLRRESEPRAARFRGRAGSRRPSIDCGRHSGTAPRMDSSRLKMVLRCQREARRLPPSDS
jgi:hypothetical protein